MINKLLTLFATLAFITSTAFADNYPSKSVKIIVPFAAGGPADIMHVLWHKDCRMSLNKHF